MTKDNNTIIHVGYSKAALTWLHDIFLQNNEINYIHKPLF
jgi:hypothetical protein